MKAFILSLTVASIVAVQSVSAAPIESVPSSRASVALRKIDAFLGEKVVADQMIKLGMNREQVDVRLAQLSDAQLEQLAAQVDLIKAGGTIQGGHPNPFGPVGCFFQQLGTLLHNIYHFIFCWGGLK